MGIPLASGGPYFGFMCCRKKHVRQMPGRIVGRTHDDQKRIGYVLTLQAREQHIRRSKATSNICTNQGLMVAAATIYMSIMGGRGLKEVAAHSHQNAMVLANELSQLSGVELMFTAPKFHEFVIQLTTPVNKVLKAMSKAGIQAGFVLSDDYPELENCLLVCATETKTEEDLQRYVATLKQVLGQ